MLESAIDDIVGAYAHFGTTKIILCALQSTNTECHEPLGNFYADQVYHVKVVPHQRDGSKDYIGWKVFNADLYGTIDMMQWASKNGYEWDRWAGVHASASGNLDILIWVMANGYEWDGAYWYWAASENHIDMLDWMHEKGYPWHDNLVWNWAVVGNRVRIIQWFRAHGVNN